MATEKGEITVRAADKPSPSAAIGSKLTRTEQAQIGDVIDRWRLNRGWNVLDDMTQAMAIQSWASVFSAAGIPFAALGDLFDRYLIVRGQMFGNGKFGAAEFGAEFLIGVWESGYAGVWHDAQAAKVLRLTDNTEEIKRQCKRCFGVGMEIVDGKGARRCDHVPKE